MKKKIRSTVKRLQGQMSIARMGAQKMISPSRAIEAELAPGHPSLPVLGRAREYNRLRSIEGGRAIMDANRVLNFDFALDLVSRLPSGDYAELGTFRGITASLIWPKTARDSTFYCFDTFAGFDDRDLSDARLDNQEEREAFANTSVDLVTKRIANGPDPRLSLRVGFFPETFQGLEDKRFRLVHIDMDLADPIRKALETFWPRMVTGGIILVHDYKSVRYPMAAETVDGFFAERGITVWPLSDRLGTAMVIKQPGMPD